MKIASAGLQMNSGHLLTQRYQSSQSLRLWIGRAAPATSSAPAAPSAAEPVKISDAGKSAQGAQSAETKRDEFEGDPRLELIRTMLEFLTGRKIKLFDPSQLTAADRQGDAAGAAGDNGAAAGEGSPREPAGYGLEYEYHAAYSEVEKTSFSASGTVRTADGREIEFRLDFTMQRSFSVESDVSLRLGDAARKKDPLVINLDVPAAQLTDTRFAFDLDADGRAESVNFVGPGSGFLAFDRNGDSRINDGSELFGPATGNGFAELAKLDGDGNGWVDENDAAFQNLRVWSKDTAGNDRLQTLAEAGVGALALARVATPFDIRDESQGLQGQVKSSGIYLDENGEAGSIQQIDLTA